MIVLVSSLIAAVVGLLVGTTLAALALVFWISGQLRPAYVPLRPWRSRYIEAFAVFLLVYLAVSFAMRALRQADLLITAIAVAAVMPLPLLWPVLRGGSVQELRHALGWHMGRGFWREAAAGILGYLAALPLLVLTLIITAVLTQVTGQTTSHPIVGLVGRDVWHTIGLYLIGCVWAPLIEETMFRGALYSHLRQRMGWIASALIVGLIFALIHPQGWLGIPTIASIGFAFAALREWRGSIIAPMVAHATNNGVMITLLLLLVA